MKALKYIAIVVVFLMVGYLAYLMINKNIQKKVVLKADVPIVDVKKA